MNKLISLTITFLLLNGCDSSKCGSEIVSRELSPDKRVEAVVSKVNCGATTDYSFKVYIVPTGSDSLGNQVFLSDHTVGLRTSWIKKQRLSITYEKARIFEYTNFWQSKDLDNFEYLVSITEAIRD
ncbi:hypothetical protein [Microbulbifer aestuariivivens]